MSRSSLRIIITTLKQNKRNLHFSFFFVVSLVGARVTRISSLGIGGCGDQLTGATPSVTLAEDPAPHCDAGVEEELHLGAEPRRGDVQVVVELRGDGLELVQAASGDVGEVMVLVVVPHVPGEEVQPSVVGVGLLGLGSLVVEHQEVLAEEVASDGVVAGAEDEAQAQVQEDARSEELV
eukprot:161297_1